MTNTKSFGRKGWTPDRLGSLEGKTFLITGTTTGTGFQATRIFLSKGARVVMLNRNAEKAAAVVATMKEEFGSDTDVRCVLMDLSTLESVRRAAAEILETVPRIDALICNAAIAQVARQELTVDGFESQFGVNHMGHFLLCGLLFERIDQSAGRVVMVGSLAYKQGLKRINFEDLEFGENYSAWDSYAQSKLAQMMFGYELQRRVAEAGKSVQVQVCHPGASRTNLIQGDNISLFLRVAWAVMAPLIAQSAEKGCWPEVLCATEAGLKSEALYGPTKRGETVGAVDQGTLEDLALDREAASRLWEVSEQRADLRFSV
ncbi:MAG: SDR family NAD(P)-dependent oxidoreductase [Deltaproteobacteria bacterium]|nr:SDR family NAD(P)-dependent oxidoreductase [Deltaproteobacteria bacterium]